MKLYNDLTQSQKKRIRAIGFGGLLKIASKILPVGFADWLMAECYDADSSELLFPSRGRIGAVFADHMITMHRDVQTSPEEKFKIKKQFKLRNSVTKMYLNVFV